MPTAEILIAEEIYMHVWPMSAPSDGAQAISGHEVELIGSHTSDAGHLDPSCQECRRLRHHLQELAERAIKNVTPEVREAADLDIYYDPGWIVVSPGNGQRPCVTVSIHVRRRPAAFATNHGLEPLKEVRQALAQLGVSER